MARRQFLGVGAASVSAALLAACGGSAMSTVTAPPGIPTPNVATLAAFVSPTLTALAQAQASAPSAPTAPAGVSTLRPVSLAVTPLAMTPPTVVVPATVPVGAAPPLASRPPIAPPPATGAQAPASSGGTVAGVMVAAKPGFVSGTVLDARGMPLRSTNAKATLTISGTSLAGQSVYYTALPDASGQYNQQVADGAYGVKASLKYQDADGLIFLFEPEPQEPSASYETAKSGLVKNFRWKLNGLIPEQSPNTATSYYGWSLILRDQGIAAMKELPKLYPGGKLQVTLTPTISTLWDGSPASVFTRTVPISVYGEEVFDVPYAKYTLSVVALDTTGKMQPLKVAAGIGVVPTDTTTPIPLTPKIYNGIGAERVNVGISL